MHVLRRRTRASADRLRRGLRVPALRAGRRSLLAPWRCSRPESKRRASAAGRPWRQPRARVARRALRLAARRIARPGGAAVHPNPNPSSALSEARPCAREMPPTQVRAIPAYHYTDPNRNPDPTPKQANAKSERHPCNYFMGTSREAWDTNLTLTLTLVLTLTLTLTRGVGHQPNPDPDTDTDPNPNPNPNPDPDPDPTPTPNP